MTQFAECIKMLKNKYKNQCLILFLLVFSLNVHSSNMVSIEVKPGITAEAEYHVGDSDNPVIVVLHGFLQTNDYLTLSNIKDAIVDNNFSMLAPGQSLGINKRKTSLPCQTTHNHTMQDSLDEIDQWMRWLKNKGHHKAILIGHSFGSVNAVAYLENFVNSNTVPDITKFIGLSLIDTEFVPDRKRREQDRQRARERIKQGDNDVYTYRLSYCHLYRAPASAFLSYADWTSERILLALKNVTKRMDVVSILGSKDKRVPNNWPDKQSKAGAQVKIVKGANHFFGGSQQIDLLDLLDEILSK